MQDCQFSTMLDRRPTCSDQVKAPAFWSQLHSIPVKVFNYLLRVHPIASNGWLSDQKSQKKY